MDGQRRAKTRTVSLVRLGEATAGLEALEGEGRTMGARKVLTWVGAAAAVFLAGCARHEHPTEHPAEHPAEHPTGTGVTLTKDDVADAVEARVAEQGGALTVKDELKGETLSLSLVKVHRDRISHVAKDTCFVCADFKTPEGKVYDLDVFVVGKTKDDLKYHDLSIHKEEGKERYTWYEEAGVWKKKHMAGSEHKGSEHKGSEPKKPGAGEHPAEHPAERPAEHPTEKPKGAEHPAEHPM
jgi:hypothetical protein